MCNVPIRPDLEANNLHAVSKLLEETANGEAAALGYRAVVWAATTAGAAAEVT